jgi:hypothetical protein
MRRIAFLAMAVLALAAIVVPAQAAKPKPTPPKSKCVAHAVSYEVSGTLTTAGALTANSDGTYSGSLTVHVAKTNNHAKASKGTTQSYTLDHAKVTFGHGVNKSAPAAGSRANLKGTITTEPKKCTAFTPTTTIKKVELHRAPK